MAITIPDSLVSKTSDFVSANADSFAAACFPRVRIPADDRDKYGCLFPRKLPRPQRFGDAPRKYKMCLGGRSSQRFCPPDTHSDTYLPAYQLSTDRPKPAGTSAFVRFRTEFWECVHASPRIRTSCKPPPGQTRVRRRRLSHLCRVRSFERSSFYNLRDRQPRRFD